MQLVDYEEYIVENNFVESGKSGYYAAWVHKFLKLHIAEKYLEKKKSCYIRRKRVNDYWSKTG